MASRVKTVKRILDVQTHLHNLAEVKYLEVQQKIDRTEKDEQELLTALSGDGALHGLFVDVTVKRLKVLRQARADLLIELERAAKVVREQGGRMKNAERLLVDLKVEERRAEERSMLDEVLEVALAGGTASLKQDD